MAVNRKIELTQIELLKKMSGTCWVKLSEL